MGDELLQDALNLAFDLGAFGRKYDRMIEASNCLDLLLDLGITASIDEPDEQPRAVCLICGDQFIGDDLTISMLIRHHDRTAHGIGQ